MLTYDATGRALVPYQDEVLSILYYPGRIDSHTVDTILAMLDRGDRHTLNRLLCDLVAVWDLYEDDKQTVMFPLEANRLQELPVDLRLLVLKAIVDAFPGLVSRM